MVSTTFTVDEQEDEAPLLSVTVRVTLQLTPVDAELRVRVGVALVGLAMEPPGQSVDQAYVNESHGSGSIEALPSSVKVAVATPHSALYGPPASHTGGLFTTAVLKAATVAAVLLSVKALLD